MIAYGKVQLTNKPHFLNLSSNFFRNKRRPLWAALPQLQHTEASLFWRPQADYYGMNVPQTDQLDWESEERIAGLATLMHSWANHKDGNNGNLYILTARENAGYGFTWIL